MLTEIEIWTVAFFEAVGVDGMSAGTIFVAIALPVSMYFVPVVVWDVGGE